MDDYRWLIRGVVLGFILSGLELDFFDALVFIIGFGFLLALQDD